MNLDTVKTYISSNSVEIGGFIVFTIFMHLLVRITFGLMSRENWYKETSIKARIKAGTETISDRKYLATNRTLSNISYFILGCVLVSMPWSMSQVVPFLTQYYWGCILLYIPAVITTKAIFAGIRIFYLLILAKVARHQTVTHNKSNQHGPQ